MNPKSWQELEQLLKAEIEGWLLIYPSQPFVDRVIKLVFSYYDKPANNNKRPADYEAWKRAAAHFMRNNWEQEKKTTTTAVKVSKKIQVTAVANDLRAKLAASQGRGVVDCPKCLNSGTVGMYRRRDNAYFTFLCNCDASQIAAQLPEHKNSRIRRYDDVAELEWERDF